MDCQVYHLEFQAEYAIFNDLTRLRQFFELLDVSCASLAAIFIARCYLFVWFDRDGEWRLILHEIEGTCTWHLVGLWGRLADVLIKHGKKISATLSHCVRFRSLLESWSLRRTHRIDLLHALWAPYDLGLLGSCLLKTLNLQRIRLLDYRLAWQGIVQEVEGWTLWYFFCRLRFLKLCAERGYYLLILLL